jgi:tetratricopeptide (TPR) repeat protein
MLCHLDQRQYDDALTGLTACLGRRPRFVWTRLLRGYVNSQLHRFDAAEQDFSAASELGLQDDALYALEVHRGTLNLLRARFAEAHSDLESAAALLPERYEAYLNLALLARQQQHPDEALHFLDRALRTSPPAAALADLHAHRADLLLRQQRFAEAVEDCDAALQVVPDRADVHGVRAQALLALKDHKAAVEAFTRYLDVGGRPERDIYRGRGQAQVQLGNYAEALQDYTLGLARGADAELLNHRGWAYFFMDAWKPALADFETAWRIDPNLVDALIGRALCRVMLGTYRAAAADAEEAWRRKPATPEMMHNLACVFAQAVGRTVGDTAAPDSASLAAHYRLRAMECLQRGLELVPAADRASFWREKMCPDTALDPIRGDDAFKQLAEKAGGTRVPG